jgi:H+/Cl- antiporter ClcA
VSAASGDAPSAGAEATVSSQPPASHRHRRPTERGAVAAALARGLGLGAAVGVVCGAASALFLALLAEATALRTRHEQLVFALPIAGLALGWLYQRVGSSIEAGTSLVLDTLHDDGPELPARMAPLVLLGTVLTHLFGGSAGREGTAVQMGASLSDWLAHRLRLSGLARRQLLIAGIAGGFGSVFGTPIAGTVFGLELAVIGHLDYRCLLPALAASLVGDLTTRALGIDHTAFPTLTAAPLSPLLLLKWLGFAAAIALTTSVFIELVHALKARARGVRLPWRMFLGGVAVVALWQLLGTSDYLGLGVPGIARAFWDPTLPWYAFAAKLAFTAITLGVGFLGGEVTPLFFIGAALGNALAPLLGLPLQLAVGVGLAATLAAAANTPLALSIMAVELMGAHALPHALIVSALAYLLTGHRGIYPGQRLRTGKLGQPLAAETRLGALRR